MLINVKFKEGIKEELSQTFKMIFDNFEFQPLNDCTKADLEFVLYGLLQNIISKWNLNPDELKFIYDFKNNEVNFYPANKNTKIFLKNIGFSGWSY